jgi:hypothetical protein
MVAHTLLVLLLASLNNDRRSKPTILLIYVLFTLTTASFVTSLFSIWNIIDGQLAIDLYTIYFYTFIASLWTQLLLRVGENLLDKPTRIISQVSIGFTALFYALLIPTVLTHYPSRLPELYYRVLAATIIVLATTSVLTTVFRRIYLFKHHESKSSYSNAPWDIIVMVVVLFLGLPIIIALISTLSLYSSYTPPATTHTQQEQTATPPSPNNDTSISSSSGETQVTQEDVDAYNATAGVNCTTLPEYSHLERDLSKGTVSSIDLKASIIYVTYDTGNTLYGRWKNNILPKVVDVNCSPINFTDIEAGGLISIYDGNTTDIYHDAQDIRVIQKLN